jgi:formylglycine-generating enzyme required for sulfatase activity
MRRIVGRTGLLHRAVLVAFAVSSPAELRADEVTNSIGMRLVEIPAGDFVMGSDESADSLKQAFGTKYEPDVRDEGPPHRVRITRPFLLGKYEVTVGEFRQFVDATGYQTDAERNDVGGKGWIDGKFGASKEFTWRTWWREQTDRHPVVNVSWNDSVAFCKWLSEKEGATYRLPTEAEWEYACRAGTTTRFSTGDDSASVLKQANFADPRTKPPGTVLTTEIGSFPANPFGLHDLHGNVWEWVADRYQADYYASSPVDDPTGPATGGSIGLRGSCWGFNPESGRSANRGRGNTTTCGYRDGFRVVGEIKK